MNNLYKEDSIKTVSPREFTRMKPGVYCGSTEYSTQLLKEIFTNAVDEHRIGHGNKIEINVSNNLYTITDYGQGFPVNKKHDEEGRTVLEAAFSVLNTSGKYDEDGAYNGISNGAFGIGGKLTNFLSKEFNVSSTTGDGLCESIQFKDGLFFKREIIEVSKGQSGTSIQFIPDEQFFKNPQIDFNYFRKYLKEVVALCPKLTVEFTVDNNETEIYKSKNGLSDLVDDKVKGKELIKNRFIYNDKKDKLGFNIVLTYTTNYSDDITAYVNCGLTESGTHLTAIKSSITRIFNKYANENNLLKKGENNLTGAELSEGLVLIFNMDAPGVQYDSQTKARVTEIDKTLLNKVMNAQFYQWLQDNPKDAKIIIEKALEARRAKEAAKKAREAVRKPKKQKGLKAKMQLSDKLIDCTTKDPKNNSLLIVEGLSAGSSAVEARNPKTQAIMMLRGKCISVLKSTKEKVLANKEYNDIITAIGAGFDDNFDVNKMNYDKIVITSDFDSDGQSIELLLITFFFRYMRPLVEAGKLYRAVTPLYIANYKNKDYYIYTEEELAEFRKDKNEKFSLRHIKGLGELDPQDLKKVCFDNELYKRINVSDIKKAEQLLQTLMGKEVTPRKEYIYTYAKEIGFEF